jgi:hypothetical protein
MKRRDAGSGHSAARRLALHIVYWVTAFVSPTRGTGLITRPKAPARVERVQERLLGTDLEDAA